MSTYTIDANGNDMGEYDAGTAAEALDAYAQDAGYTDYADVVKQFGDDATATKIDSDALVRAVSIAKGIEVFQDSYGNGVALVEGVSYPTYYALAESIGKSLSDFSA
jgi:hypothetical protein